MTDNNTTTQSSKIETLQLISRQYDKILDKPAEQWSQKEINIYLMLQRILDKYQLRYSQSQFRLDVRDIKRNVKSTPWYNNSPYQKTINWCLDQIDIKSYQKSSRSGHFKIKAKFTQAHVMLTIVKKDQFNFLLENESMDIKTNDLDNVEYMTQIFQINPKIPLKHREKVIYDINMLVREIALFYN